MQVVRAWHQAVENFARDRHEPGVCDPGAVVAVAGFALLVGAHARECDLVGPGVVLDGDLRRHPAHRESSAAVAALDHELRICPQERRCHGDGAAIRQDEFGAMAEFLDDAENVVPASAVEPDDPVAKLIEDLVDLERGRDGLDENRHLHRAARQAELLFGMRDDIRPKPGLEAVLELGQVEIRPGAAALEFGGIVVNVNAEVDECARDRVLAEQPVLLREVPAARPDDQDSRLFVQAVLLALR
jgi:hypothetical protein